jgi:hypothetical protein
MTDAAKAIKNLCEKYNGRPTSETDVCTWVRDRVYEKIRVFKPSSQHESIWFRGALLEFIEEKALFCIYLQTDEGNTLDITFPLAMYVRREYGVEITNCFDKNIILGFTEAMDLAELITDDICVWVGQASDAVTT